MGNEYACRKMSLGKYCLALAPELQWMVRYGLTYFLSVVAVLLVMVLLTAGNSRGPRSVSANQSADSPRAIQASGTANHELFVPQSQPSLPPLICDRRIAAGRSPYEARKKVKRTRAEILREREELLQKTIHEIDAILADYHARLPRSRATSIGAIYCRYSSRFQNSIADQVRTLLEAAVGMGVYIPRENVFFDMAVRGFKDRRPGLDQLRSAMKRKAFDTFLIFTTSRLFRRTYKAMQFVEEELVERGIRGVFLKSGIDTAKGDQWRLMFQMLCAMDEAAVRAIGVHVRSAHEGLFLRGMVCTSLPLGFTGEDVPGEFTKRKLPRQRIIVDPVAAAYIMKIYKWYVIDGLSMDEIARELNDDDEAPAPAKSLTGLWTHGLVRKHLMNPAYRGYWAYGAKETQWIGGKDYAYQVAREEPLKSAHFETLRIVADELWYGAQELLAKEQAKSGRKPRDTDRVARPNVLKGLYVCPEHERQLSVGGAYGATLYCPHCRALKAENRPLFTQLNRGLALRLTCKKLGELIQGDAQLVEQIVAKCREYVEQLQMPDLTALPRLKSQADRLATKIQFNRRNPGETEGEHKETLRLIKELRDEQTAVLAEMARLEGAQERIIEIPTPAQVAEELSKLGTILESAAFAESDSEMRAVRRIIDLITGGRIELFQQGARKPQAGWLQGRFRVPLLAMLIEQVSGARVVTEEPCVEVVIDYQEPSQLTTDSERAKELYDQGLMNAQIAERLGCSPSRLTKLLKHWFESRGQVMPDGRTRRSSLVIKHLQAPFFQEIAGRVMELYDQDLLLLEIATRMDCDHNTITSAIRWWHEQRGLPVPDGRTRRKNLERKCTNPHHVDREQIPLEPTEDEESDGSTPED